MGKMKKVIVVEGTETARFLLKIGKSEILIIETPSLGESESYEKGVFEGKGEIFEGFYELV